MGTPSGRAVAPGGTRSPVGGRVAAPAAALMMVGGLGSLVNVLALALNLLGAGMGTWLPGATDGRLQTLFSGGLGVVTALLGMLVSAVMLFGAMRMRALEGYAFAVLAAILALLPCCPCCFLSLPVGVWALVVLMDREVREAFRG